jgi:hypothetical protein
MVRRDRSRQDRRAVEIAVTPEGRRVAHAGKRLMVDLLNELVAPYSKAEIDTLILLLQHLLSRLQNAAGLSKPADPESASSNRRGKRRSAGSTLKRPKPRPREIRGKSLE